MNNSKLTLYGGWTLSILPSLMLLLSAAMKFSDSPEFKAGFDHLGWPMSVSRPLGFIEIAVVLIYLFPRTAALGAILCTGYLGGAMAAHIRIGEQAYTQFLLGVMIWGGLWFRDARLRSLIPLMR
jgi:hypothetical protein